MKATPYGTSKCHMGVTWVTIRSLTQFPPCEFSLVWVTTCCRHPEPTSVVQLPAACRGAACSWSCRHLPVQILYMSIKYKNKI